MLSKMSRLLFENENRQSVWLVCCLIAALSLYIGLIFPYRGEEGLYPATSYEMLFNHDYLNVFFQGVYYGRPPLFNWLMIAVASLVGYKHMLLAARLVTISLTVCTAGLTYFFTKELTKNTLFSLFTVLCYFSGDLLFRRSWFAYADPTFAFFIVASIVFMWVGVNRNQQRWLFLAVPALIAAFLTKALTCYAFYGVTVLVLLFSQKKWRYFFYPTSILLHLVALSAPLLWFGYIADHSGHRALWDIYHRFTDSTQHFNFVHYLLKRIGNAGVYALRFAPLSLIVIFVLVTKRFNQQGKHHPAWLKAVALSAGINFLPYWLTPSVYQIRYLLPLYPFIALMMAYVLWHSTGKVFRFSFWTLLFFILMKVVLSPIGLPFFEHMSYGYPPVVKNILQLSKGYPLVGGGPDTIIARLDAALYPSKPVIIPTAEQKKKGHFYLSAAPMGGGYKLVKSYRITDKYFALYCYKSACDKHFPKKK